jgi:tryptophan 2,3-dioxygenase
MYIIYVTIDEHVICMCGVYDLWVKLMIDELYLCVKLIDANITVG